MTLITFRGRSGKLRRTGDPPGPMNGRRAIHLRDGVPAFGEPQAVRVDCAAHALFRSVRGASPRASVHVQ